MRNRITKRGYRTLAVIWTGAAASVAVAFVRRLAEFNLFLLLLLVLSMLTAANFWKAYRRADEITLNPFDVPPKFADNPVLFTDDPPSRPNKELEENTHER